VSVLQLAEYWLRPLEVLERGQRRHGDAFHLRVPAGPALIVSAPADVRRVFTAPPDVLLGGAANQVLEPLMGASSLIVLDGAPYNRQRRLLSPPLSGERMQLYTDAVREATDAAIDGWRPGDTVSLLEAAQRVTLEVILRTVFGVRGHPALERALRAVLRASTSLGVLFMPRAVLRRPVAEADRLIFAEIARRRDAARGVDVLSLLLDARDEDGSPMTDREIRDELVTLLTGGLETTAATIAWTLATLLQHPEAEARARDDADYLDAAVRETLRLRPLFNLSVRRAAQPFEIAGRMVPRGGIVAPCMYLAQRRPESWPEPERFLPERFLGNKPDPATWFPFGGGHRRCIGLALALHETRIFVGRALRRLRLEPAGPPPRPVRHNIILVPSGGARARIARWSTTSTSR
jgi:cytochrome P450